MKQKPVVIVGAGPTGMTAAALLARLAVPVVMIERAREVSNLPRAVHFDDEVMRIFHAAGFSERIARISTPMQGMVLVDRDQRPILTFDRGTSSDGADGAFSLSNGFDQPDLEREMRAAIAERPEVSLELGTTVEDIKSDGRRITLRDASGNARVIESAAVLGCDGARSFVREAMGIESQDLGFHGRWLVVDAHSDDPLPFYEGCIQLADPDRPTTYVCVGRGRHRWEFMLGKEEKSEELNTNARVRELLQPWLGERARTIEIRRHAVYTFHSLVARRYRRGNVFLLGDAAHQMPPFIGQGMGAGVRDAANLAWKLASVLSGAARESLLDTYESERRPHVCAVVGQSVLLGRIMQTSVGVRYRDAVLRKFGNIGPVHRALLRRAFPTYQSGPIVKPRRSGPAGGLAPRAPITIDGHATHLDDVVGQRFAILTRAQLASDFLGNNSIALLRVANDASAPIDQTGTLIDQTGILTAWLNTLSADCALIRPDMVVMASGPTTALPTWLTQLSRYLR